MVVFCYKLLQSRAGILSFRHYTTCLREASALCLKLEELTELEIHYKARGKHLQALKS